MTHKKTTEKINKLKKQNDQAYDINFQFKFKIFTIDIFSFHFQVPQYFFLFCRHLSNIKSQRNINTPPF